MDATSCHSSFCKCKWGLFAQVDRSKESKVAEREREGRPEKPLHKHPLNGFQSLWELPVYTLKLRFPKFLLPWRSHADWMWLFNVECGWFKWQGSVNIKYAPDLAGERHSFRDHTLTFSYFRCIEINKILVTLILLVFKCFNEVKEKHPRHPWQALFPSGQVSAWISASPCVWRQVGEDCPQALSLIRVCRTLWLWHPNHPKLLTRLPHPR